MNIKRAKQEIKDAVKAYLLKDAYGIYEIPAIRQRFGSTGNRKDPDYGGDCKGMRYCSGVLHHHPPYQAKCHGASLYSGKGFWRGEKGGHRVYHE